MSHAACSWRGSTSKWVPCEPSCKRTGSWKHRTASKPSRCAGTPSWHVPEQHAGAKCVWQAHYFPLIGCPEGCAGDMARRCAVRRRGRRRGSTCAPHGWAAWGPRPAAPDAPATAAPPTLHAHLSRCTAVHPCRAVAASCCCVHVLARTPDRAVSAASSCAQWPLKSAGLIMGVYSVTVLSVITCQ